MITNDLQYSRPYRWRARSQGQSHFGQCPLLPLGRRDMPRHAQARVSVDCFVEECGCLRPVARCVAFEEHLRIRTSGFEALDYVRYVGSLFERAAEVVLGRRPVLRR